MLQYSCVERTWSRKCKRCKEGDFCYHKLSLVLALGVVVTLFVGHDGWVGLFSNSPLIKDEFASLRFFLAASITLDSIQGVLSGNKRSKKASFFLDESEAKKPPFLLLTGVARGCGWQRVVTVINLGTFYFIGMPIAAFCGFS